MQIVLASKSPRRKELLEKEGYDFVIDASSADETSVKEKDIKKLVMNIARLKAEAVAKMHGDSIIIGADTLVYFNGKEIGQQETDEDARKLMKELAGKTHEVYTGICVINTSNNKIIQDFDISYVTFNNVSDKIIDKFIKTGVYRGKAGAYDIADKEFEGFVKSVKGSISNVRGLPLEKLKKVLKEIQNR